MRKGKKDFWNKEYGKAKRRGKNASHLTLSDEPAEDLVKFTRWLLRNRGRKFLNVTVQVLDVGCGNGRNLIFLAKEFNMRGIGIDFSPEAIAQARKSAREFTQISFEVRSIASPLRFPDASVTLALDMMSSHVLKRFEREKLRAEILRVLKPSGWLFFKSFWHDPRKLRTIRP